MTAKLPLILMGLLVATTAHVSAQGAVEIGIRSGTLNGRPVSEWTLDEITDELGRPTAVVPGVGGIVGARLLYHPRGLEFWLAPKEKDVAQHLQIVTVHLSRSWDGDHSEWYQVFDGRIIPSVTANWKQDRLLDEFQDMAVEVTTAEERNRELKAADWPVAVQIKTDFVSFPVGDMTVTFLLEPNTSFLERFNLRTGAARK